MPEKPSVRLVDVAGLIDPLVGGLGTPVDGTSVLAGDEVLLPEPPNGSAYAGPWVAATGAWSRRSDWDAVSEMVPGDWWYVREGSQFAGTTWQFENTSQPATLNVTPLTIGWRTRRRVVEPGGAFQIQGTTPPILTEVAISDVQSTFIEGLGVEYVSANALRVKAGACYVPGISGVVDVDADVDLTSLTLTASTWYYCYAYSAGGGVGGVELSPQRPASPYRGNARAKGGGVGGVLNNTDPDIEPDDTRRYLGAIRCGPTANTMLRFRKEGDFCSWELNASATTAAGGARVLDAARATANTLQSLGPNTLQSLGPLVPPTSRMAFLFVDNLYNSAPGGTFFTNPDDTLSPAAGAGQLYALVTANSTRGQAAGPVTLDASQQIKWSSTAAAIDVFLSVLGYWEHR